ncbi:MULTISPECIES: SMI1/KNR4 family protein [Pseudomonas]|uniref:Knr4/Smi1-like domain-containing protein n=1 Tax=Pseudomonas fluorescens TaxID=294 RepID=A0A5E6WYF6_PSEFL|nr:MULTISPECIES: SMI1/KNR4 family protein [Pseudomonas]VVN33001.1 hypothetical protein PS652_04948 [Pseudomonas fluorescens]
MSKSRVIGTTTEAIHAAEAELGRQLPSSFSEWLMDNNGKSIDSLTVFPVYDARDPRKTWDSIVRHFKENWQGWIENFPQSRQNLECIVPFAEFGTGDYYCFDYSKPGLSGEPSVTRWSHETGEALFIADSFSAFLKIPPSLRIS